MRLSVLVLCLPTIPLTAAGPSPSTSDDQVRVTVSEELGSAGALYHYRVNESGSV